jgi:hypothetical protein
MSSGFWDGRWGRRSGTGAVGCWVIGCSLQLEQCMVFKRTDSLQEITRRLGWIVSTCKLQGLLKLFNDHVQAQHFFCRLLNAIYQLQLQQMDRIQVNYPAIDLGDAGNRIAYQITTEKRGDKVQHTLDTFLTHHLDKTYDTLKILVIGDRQETYKSVKVPNGLQFDCDRDILDIPELVKHLDTLPSTRLEELEVIMRQELLSEGSSGPRPRTALMPEADQILLVACEMEGKEKGRIILTFDSEGWNLTCGNKGRKFPHTDRPAQARCQEAIKQLLQRDLIADSGIKCGTGGNIIGWYNVQDAGYLLVAELLSRPAKGGSVNATR